MSRFAIKEEELERLLLSFTRDITALDKAGKYDPITGRDTEVGQMELILLQRLRKNVLLIAGPGVGKTALFIGLAQKINAGTVPKPLQGARVIELDMSMIGAGSQSRADLDGRLVPIIKGVAERNALRDKPPILFCIDEMHQLMLSYKTSASAGVTDMMKPYLTSGDLYVIGATTLEEYQDYVQIDPAIDRRFQKISLAVPDVDMTIMIVTNLKNNFEKHYNLSISAENCVRIVKLAERFIRKRNNPDKSILVLDLACAIAVKNGITNALDTASIEAAIAAEAGIDARAVK